MRTVATSLGRISHGPRFTLLGILLWFVAAGAASRASDQNHPQPGKAHELLAMDAGTWDGEVKMYFAGPDAPSAEFKSVEVNELVSGGMYLRTTFKCPMGDVGDFEGHSLMGFDPRSKQYVGTWVDNFTAAPTQLKGEFDDESKTMTVRSVVVDGAGQELNQKQVTTWVDESTKIFVIYLVVNADGKNSEIKLMEIESKKRT